MPAEFTFCWRSWSRTIYEIKMFLNLKSLFFNLEVSSSRTIQCSTRSKKFNLSGNVRIQLLFVTDVFMFNFDAGKNFLLWVTMFECGFLGAK